MPNSLAKAPTLANCAVQCKRMPSAGQVQIEKVQAAARKRDSMREQKPLNALALEAATAAGIEGSLSYCLLRCEHLN